MRISVYEGLSGTDHVMGTSEADEIYVRRTDVTVDAYGGDDYIQIAKDGDAIVNAGAGNDIIDAEGKYETISGGAGSDVINISRSYMSVDGGTGDDKINVSALLNSIDHITISGGAGNDLFKFDPTGATSSNSKGNTIDVTITDLSDGDSLRNGYVGNIGLEYSISGGNVVLSEPGAGSVTVTLKGVSDISQVANVTYRTKNETKTLGEIFDESGSDYENSSSSGGTSTTTNNSATSTTNTNGTANITTGGGNTTINYYTDNSTNTNINIGDNNSNIVIGDNNVNNINITKYGDTYTYSGGNRTITNYQQGEVVRLDDYQGLDNISGNSFYIKSQSGRLEIQNSRDKFIGYSASNSEVIAYSYVAGRSGNVDGRGKSQAEILIGADNSDNQIYAGSGGSSLWGGNGGADVLTGGNGYDEFFYAMGSGSDVVQNASSNDIVNLLGVSLSQISGYSYDSSSVNLQFADGGNLRVEGTSAVGYRVENQTYMFNRYSNQWTTK